MLDIYNCIAPGSYKVSQNYTSVLFFLSWRSAFQSGEGANGSSSEERPSTSSQLD